MYGIIPIKLVQMPSNEYDINQLIEWMKHKQINFNPAYQREGGIWKDKDKSYLIDTILENKPMPEFFFQKRWLKESKFKYDVVDGKQRLLVIFDFYYDKKQENGNYIKVARESNDEKITKKFRQLSEEDKKNFYKYKVRIYEIPDLGITDIIDIFIRLNKTGARLVKQEIRKAHLNGDFLKLAEELCKITKATKNFFKKQKILKTANIQRMGDIEFACELLALILSGIQDKKKTLDQIMDTNRKLKDKNKLKGNYVRIINIIKKILPDIKSTRFCKKSDFYSLFAAIRQMDEEKHNIENPKCQKLMRVILINLSTFVDKYGETKKTKNSDIKRYYDSTQEGTDTIRNRTIRKDFIKNILSSAVGKKDKKRPFTPEQRRLLWHTSKDKKCEICGKPIESWDDLEADHKKPYALGNPTRLSNGQIAHWRCNRKKGKKNKRFK